VDRMAALAPSVRPPMTLAIIPPNSDGSLLLQQGKARTECPHRAGAFEAVRSHILQGMGVYPGDDNPRSDVVVMASDSVSQASSGPIGDGIALEQGLSESLSGMSLKTPIGARSAKLRVKRAILKRMPIREQLAVIAQSRVLIGEFDPMLSLCLFALPSAGSGVVEIASGHAVGPRSRFENIALMSGNSFERITVPSDEGGPVGRASTIVHDAVDIVQTMLHRS